MKCSCEQNMYFFQICSKHYAINSCWKIPGCPTTSTTTVLPSIEAMWRETMVENRPVHNKKDNYNNKYTGIHGWQRSISLKSVWLWIFLLFISMKNKIPKESNHIVPLCRYYYYGQLDFSILTELLLNLYSYSYRPWCERALKFQNDTHTHTQTQT